MPIAVQDLSPSALELVVDEAPEADECRDLLAMMEERIARAGRIELVLRIPRLEGWSPVALWKDLEIGSEHYDDVARIAIVTDDVSVEAMVGLASVFTGARVELFAERDLQRARAWATGAAERV